MEIETEDILLQKCRMLIQERLGWGDPAAWATNDYELLSRKIQEATNVNLSIATLKRLWGKIRYDSRPTITTLNTLAQFLGFENWRAFTQHHSTLNGNGHAHPGIGQPRRPPTPKPASEKRWLWIAAICILVAGTLVVMKLEKKSAPADPSLFQFSSKKVVDVGVPNTVIFDYDATAASPADTLFIQQSWDKRLRKRVTREQKKHTSIYYYPGFFEAKLVVNEKVVKEHNLLIKTDGWISCIEQNPVPIYFSEREVRSHGIMSLSIEKIRNANVPLQPAAPWTAFYNVRDFGAITSDDFVFETAVRNDYKEGSAVCQMSQLHILMEGAKMVIPLSIKGCVSELNFMDLDGKKSDLSALGVDFGDWVRVKCVFKDKKGVIFINDKRAFTLNADMPAVKVIGIGYRFQGTGSVDFVKLSKSDGEIVYEESF
jgi:hypothetical protein